MNFKEIEELLSNIDEVSAQKLFNDFINKFNESLLDSDITKDKKKIEPSEDDPTIIMSKSYPKRKQDDYTVEIINKGETDEPIAAEEVTEEIKLLSQRDREEIIMEIKTLLKHNLLPKAIVEIERKISMYPRDIILMRKFVDILIGYNEIQRAIDILFIILQLHFEGGDKEAMKRVINQIINLDPSNRRAQKLKEKFNF